MLLSPELSPEIDALVLKGLAPEAGARFPTALAMARELSKVIGLASQLEVSEWVERVAKLGIVKDVGRVGITIERSRG